MLIARTGRPRKVRPGPGRGVILSKERARKRSKKFGGGTLTNGFQLNFTVEQEMAYDIDQRKLVEHVSVGMAEFFRKRLHAGLRPDAGRLPVSKSAKNQAGRRAPWVGMFSGYMADNWWLGKIIGTTLRASRAIKPYGGDGGRDPPGMAGPGRSDVIKQLLRRRRGGPVDFQSVRGAAHTEMARLFHQAVSMSFPNVRTFAVPRVREGTLPEVRRAG